MRLKRSTRHFDLFISKKILPYAAKRRLDSFKSLEDQVLIKITWKKFEYKTFTI